MEILINIAKLDHKIVHFDNKKALLFGIIRLAKNQITPRESAQSYDTTKFAEDFKKQLKQLGIFIS